MFVKVQREKGLIKTTRAPVRVIAQAPDGTVKLEISCRLSQQALQRGHAVRTVILSRALMRKTITDDLQAGDVAALVDRIVSIVPAAKAAQKAAELLVIARSERSINSMTSSDRALPGKRVAFTRRDELQRRVEPAAALIDPGTVRAGSAVAVDQGRSFLEDIIVHGVDPANSFGSSARNSKRTAEGLVPRRAQKSERHAALSAATADVEQRTAKTQVAVIVAKDPDADALFVDVVSMPAERLISETGPIDQVAVRLELIDSTGMILDFTTSSIDLARHVAAFRTPRSAPNVVIVRTQTGAALHITPGDRMTQAVRVARRCFSRASRSDERYTFVGEFVLGAHERAGVHVPVPSVRAGAAVYRVIPVGPEGRVGSEYASVVVVPSSPASSRHAVLTVTPVSAGLSVEVADVPARVRAVEIFRRDMTVKERAAVSLGSHFIDSAHPEKRIVVIDGRLKPGHVYEHTCRLTYVDGRTEAVGLVHTEYDQAQEGRALTSITDLQVGKASGKLDVAFTIATTLLDTDMDTVKAALHRQGIDSFFDSDVLQERERLKGLLMHKITRVDLTTGARDDFGTVLDARFVDSALRVQTGIAALEDGHRYRYEVEALLRMPETMFDDLVKVRTDPVTRRQHSMRPAKHMHPITIARGTVVTPRSLATRHSASAFGHGRIGSVVSVDVTFAKQSAVIVDPTAAILDARTVILTWHVRGTFSSLDHFLLFKETPAGMQELGKCHVDFPHGNFQFLHTIRDPDEGPATYSIVPVDVSYDWGTTVVTDEVEASSV